MTISVNDSRLRFKLVVVVVVVVDVLVGSSVSVVSNVEVAAVELSMSFEKTGTRESIESQFDSSQVDLSQVDSRQIELHHRFP